MPTTSFWILITIWAIILAVFMWIVIDFKRYPEEFAAIKGNRKEQMEAEKQWQRKKS